MNSSQKQIFLVIVVSAVFALVWACETHLVTEVFVAVMSLFFKHFSVESTSVVADIALFVFMALALYGLATLFRLFFMAAVVAVFISIAAWYFLAPHDDDLRPVKLSSSSHLERRDW